MVMGAGVSMEVTDYKRLNRYLYHLARFESVFSDSLSPDF